MRRWRVVGLLALLPTFGVASSAQAQPATITTLDSAGDVGRHNAIAYGPSGLAFVSYHDVTNGDIKVAVCQDAACTSALIRVVDDSGTASGHTSIAVPADGRPLVAYQSGPVIRLARCGDPTCATATSVAVEGLAAPAPGTAIGVGGDVLAVIAYGDAANGQPRIAHCNDADCTTRTVTPYPGHGSQNASLTILGDGLAQFAFDTGTAIHVGRCANSACTLAFFSVISLIDPFYNASLATGADGRAVMALISELVMTGPPILQTELSHSGSGGTIAISFINPAVDVTAADHARVVHYGGSPQRLQVTRCEAAICGTPGPFPPTYPIEVPGIGQTPSFAIGPDDVGLVSYYDETNADLKVAYLLGGPELNIGDVGVVEGNNGLTDVFFPVTISQPANATVDFATVSGGAQAGTDFVATLGTLTFTPGSLTQAVTVSIIGDLVPEDAMELFRVLLSNPQGGGAFIVDGEGRGRIFDDDFVSPRATAELGHGITRVDDLAALPGPIADVDLYRVAQAPFASYEVVADALSGDVVPLDLRLVGNDGVTTVHPSTPTGSGSARSLRWLANGETPVLNQLVRVSGGCATFCGADDVYRLRMYDTTLRGSRFNNSGSQTTVLLLQNPTNAPVNATVRFWAADGERLGTFETEGGIPARGLLVLQTATVPGAAGRSGTLTVAHDAPYGALVGKAVALEPATGFSFDTPLEPRPR